VFPQGPGRKANLPKDEVREKYALLLQLLTFSTTFPMVTPSLGAEQGETEVTGIGIAPYPQLDAADYWR
jgi:hypothetical protein